MSECVILYRVNGGRIEFVYNADSEQDIAVYPSHAAANRYARDNALFQSGQATYQIVECKEL